MECSYILSHGCYSNTLEVVLYRITRFNIFCILPVVLFVFLMTGSKKINIKSIIINLMKTIVTWIICFFVYIFIKLLIGVTIPEIECIDYLTLPKIGGLIILAYTILSFYAYIFMFVKRINLSKKKKKVLILTLLILAIILEIIMWFIYPYFIVEISNCQA